MVKGILEGHSPEPKEGPSKTERGEDLPPGSRNSPTWPELC